MNPHSKMPLKYFLGWLAALWLLGGSGIARYPYTNSLGPLFSVLFLAAISYGLARLGWRLGWFRKTP